VRSESVPHWSCSYRSQGEPCYQLASGGCAIISSFFSPTDQGERERLSLTAHGNTPA
ncbi:DNA-dependent RNA polymerase beta' subunit/160 kD subunit, partial [Giardia duodenalis]